MIGGKEGLHGKASGQAGSGKKTVYCEYNNNRIEVVGKRTKVGLLNNIGREGLFGFIGSSFGGFSIFFLLFKIFNDGLSGLSIIFTSGLL